MPSMTIRQAADAWGVSEATIRRKIKRGELPALRLGINTIRLDPADVERLGRPTAEAQLGGQEPPAVDAHVTRGTPIDEYRATFTDEDYAALARLFDELRIRRARLDAETRPADVRATT